MLAVSLAAFCTPSPAASETLEGISQAFFRALDRHGSPAFTAAWAIIALGITIAVVRWLREEAERERAEQRALDARRAAAEADTHAERRDWVRIPARLAMTIRRPVPRERPRHEVFETENVGGGGVAYYSSRPPARGTPVDLTLQLDEPGPLSMRGVVVRVEPPRAPDAPSLVALRFRDVSNAKLEHLSKWVAEKERRDIAEARRGPLCRVCGRPLPEDTLEAHSTCAARSPTPTPAAPPADPPRIA